MSESRIVAGIDPGPHESAVVEWNGHQVVSARDMANERLMDYLLHYHNQVAIEWIESMGMVVGKEVFETVYWIGQIAYCAGTPRLIPRRDVKLHICQSPRAKDGNIRQALIDRFGVVGTKKNPGPLFGISNHKWSALAIAVVAFDTPLSEHEASFHRMGAVCE